MDDIERRLRADAARSDSFRAPSLDDAVQHLDGAGRSRVAVVLAVAATVIAIAGAAVFAGYWNGRHRDDVAAEQKATVTVFGMLRGSATQPADQRLLHVVIVTRWPCGAAEPPPPAVRLVSQDDQSVELALGVRGRGEVVAATRGREIDTASLGAPAEVFGVPDPGPAATSTAPTATTPPASPTRPAASTATDEGSSSSPAGCPAARADGVDVRLAAPMGDRTVLVGGRTFPAFERGFGAAPRYLPSGFVRRTGQDMQDAPPLRIVREWRDASGATIRLQYSASSSRPSGAPLADEQRIDSGIYADVYQAAGRRSLAWQQPGGAYVTLTSLASRPLPTGELVTIARGL